MGIYYAKYYGSLFGGGGRGEMATGEKIRMKLRAKKIKRGKEKRRKLHQNGVKCLKIASNICSPEIDFKGV